MARTWGPWQVGQALCLCLTGYILISIACQPSESTTQPHNNATPTSKHVKKDREARLVNTPVLKQDKRLYDEFKRLVDLKVTADDPDLVELIKEMLNPPPLTPVKLSRPAVETEQSKVVMDVLENQASVIFSINIVTCIIITPKILI